MNPVDELYMQHHPAEAVPGMRDELLAVHIDARAELLDQPFYSAGRFLERFESYVRKAFQHRGYAHRLHDELLADRQEERATLLVRSDNPARLLYRRWGWTQVGSAQPFPDSPRFESMVLELKGQDRSS